MKYVHLILYAISLCITYTHTYTHIRIYADTHLHTHTHIHTHYSHNEVYPSYFTYYHLLCDTHTHTQFRLADLHEWVRVSLGAPFIRSCATSKQKRFVNYTHTIPIRKYYLPSSRIQTHIQVELELFWQLNCVLMPNWIVWNRTDYLHKNGFGIDTKLIYHKTQKTNQPTNQPHTHTHIHTHISPLSLFQLWSMLILFYILSFFVSHTHTHTHTCAHRPVLFSILCHTYTHMYTHYSKRTHAQV